MSGFAIERFIVNGREIKFAQWKHHLKERIILDDGVVDFYSRIIPHDKDVIDVGASNGDTAAMFSLCTSGVVHAFEPNPAAYSVLVENAKLNNKIAPYDYAIMDNPGEYVFQYTDPAHCGGGYRQDPTATFDYGAWKYPVTVHGCPVPQEILTEKIGFVKTDVEGYDYEVLKQIEWFLKKFKPAIQFEVYPHMPNEKKLRLVHFVHELGYQIFRKTGCLIRRTSNDQLIPQNIDGDANPPPGYPSYPGLGGNYPIDLYALPIPVVK